MRRSRLSAEREDILDQCLELREVVSPLPIICKVELPLLQQAQQMHQAALFACLSSVVCGQKVADQHAGKTLAQPFCDDLCVSMTVNGVEDHSLNGTHHSQ